MFRSKFPFYDVIDDKKIYFSKKSNNIGILKDGLNKNSRKKNLRIYYIRTNKVNLKLLNPKKSYYIRALKIFYFSETDSKRMKRKILEVDQETHHYLVRNYERKIKSCSILKHLGFS